jgi:hypothetical protein
MNKAKTVLFTVILCSLYLTPCVAQYQELGIELGVSRYKGELSPHLIDTKFLHFAGGIFYRHNWTRHWGYRAEINYGKISGDDKQLQNEFEKIRNLNFYSTIWDGTFVFEFNFFPYENGHPDYPFTPYIFSGLSIFHFNPKSDWNGQTYELQPLGTEGQGLDGNPDFYHRVVMALPIGGGIKFNVGAIGFALQVSARRTYTTYLDDVSGTYPNMTHLLAARGPAAVHFSDPSVYGDTIAKFYPTLTSKQRGNGTNDWYVFGTINISVRLNSFIKEFCKPFKRRRYA